MKDVFAVIGVLVVCGVLVAAAPGLVLRDMASHDDFS